MTTFNLTCEAVEATLPDYLDETLEAWVRESIDEHLGECARCAALARDLRNIERDTAALPPLVPERDIWPEVAHGIGAPVTTSGWVPESEPLMASSEPPVSASGSVPASEPSLPTPEPVLPTTESSLVTAEPLLPTAELPLAPPEPSVPANEPLLPSAVAPVPTTTPGIAFPERREKRRGPVWSGLAAAALVLVTAGTTFLLTARWLGPGRTSFVVTDTVTRRVPSSVTPRADGGIRASSVGSQQIASGSSAPPPPLGSPRSSLTAATTSAPQLTRATDEVVYDKEINMLQAMRRRRKDELDASTDAVIERNLRIIDSNIAQIRAALQKDPGSPVLDGQVSRALELKVELLRRVAMLRSNT
jgi:hypothetical protein